MESLKPEDLARALVGLHEWAQKLDAEPAEDGLSERLREHMGGETAGLPVVSRTLEGYQRANFQVAIDVYLDEPEREAELVGLPMTHGYRMGLAELVKGSRGPWMGDEHEIGPIEYEPVDIGERRIMCVAAGLWLVTERNGPLLLMLHRSDHGPHQTELGLEIMANERPRAEAVLTEMERLMRDLNPYRGHILALSRSPFGGTGVQVQRLPAVTREDIVYPPGVMERIERHTKTFSEHAAALRAAGRHMKRGLLLHGPPGTGKTLTVMYLSNLMPERTVLLLTGSALAAIGPACAMARELEPAMVVLEDVDLVAEERVRVSQSPLLFEMLNEMDGLGEDADIIFALTTNRPEVIEPALASRPGRIDLAVRMPLPDEQGRERLLALYGRGLQLALRDRASFIAATAGTTPAFIREVLRRAALLAAERGDANVITDERLTAAIDELRSSDDGLTGSLLGSGGSAAADSPIP